uniref:Uncharacterized protein n=1 Tax=Cucumis melo TaxID=3656 RepID=A0A9I9DA85_CUCME
MEELKENQIVVVRSSTWIVASIIIETEAKCAKRKVEHYYELGREKYKLALNKNNYYSGDSKGEE